MVLKFNISESYNEQNNLESMHLEFVKLATVPAISTCEEYEQ